MTQSVTPQMAPFISRLMWPLFKRMTRPDEGRSAAKAARSAVCLASSAEVEGLNGAYLNSKSEVVECPKAVLDQATRRHVWEMAEQLAHLTVGGSLEPQTGRN